MKAKTKDLLSTLCANNSRASLTDLWSSISSLSDAEFQSLLDEFYTPKPPKKKKAPTKPAARSKPSMPSDDRPVTRIAHELRSRLSMGDELAIESLSSALIAKGVAISSLPEKTIRPLENWLVLLISHVSESSVLAAAKRLKF